MTYCARLKNAVVTQKNHRIVIVDTNYKHSENFHEDLNHYFQSRQNRLFLSLQDAPVDLEPLEVYPECLQGKLNSYQTSEKIAFQPFKERDSEIAIQFDFAKHYPHQLLVHHQGGGGSISSSALLRLKLTDTVKLALLKRLKTIERSYYGIHVRHTDYRSDYTAAIELFKKNHPTAFLSLQIISWYLTTSCASCQTLKFFHSANIYLRMARLFICPKH